MKTKKKWKKPNHTCLNIINQIFTLPYTYLPDCRYPSYSGYNAANPFFKMNMYFYNADSGRCETFSYSGRGGNRNRFRNPIDCLRRCACYAPMDTGSCTNSTGTTRYYYNRHFKMCTTFLFTGCEGNDNNFNDFMSCQMACGRRGGGSEIET